MVIIMDYNYVRMRNAEKSGDHNLSEQYKRLYKRGIVNVENTRHLTAAICILGAVVALLGAYIVYDAVSSIPDNENNSGGYSAQVTQGVSD